MNKIKPPKTFTSKEISQTQTKNQPSPILISTPELEKTPTLASATPEIIELPQSELTGDIVRQARTAMHMNQRQVARAMGMSQSWVRDIEMEGRDKPVPQKYAVKLKEILGIAS